MVGGRYRLQREGDIPSSSVKNDQEIFVTPVGEHPVIAGIEPFHITDEAYKHVDLAQVRPLLTTDNPTSDTSWPGSGRCETSEVVAIQLGPRPLRRSGIRRTGPWCTMPSSGRREEQVTAVPDGRLDLSGHRQQRNSR